MAESDIQSISDTEPDANAETRLDAEAEAEIDAGKGVPHGRVRAWLAKLAKGETPRAPAFVGRRDFDP